MLILNHDNYHSPEANQQYMGHSQYKQFAFGCEAKALAEVRGEYKEPPSDSLLAGSYVHAWNEGTLEKFKKNNPDIFTKKGELRAEFKFAEDMIACLEEDAFCRFVLAGEKEVIITAEFAGAMWKVMLDVYAPDKGRYVELKTTKSIRELQWSESERQKVSFIETYGYVTQAAIYTEIERLATGRDCYLEPVLVAVSKEKPPDKEIISLDDKDRREYELTQIKLNMPRILAIKDGYEKPIRCEKCAYCRQTKKLSKILHFSELTGKPIYIA